MQTPTSLTIPRPRPRFIARVPNVISTTRILAAPVLAALAWTRHEDAFATLLVLALLSDIADGAIARLFKVVSPLGSMLDSMADLLTFLAAAFGVWQFHHLVVVHHALAFASVLAMWFGVSAIGFWRYGRMASFHTVLARVTAYLMGAFLVVLSVWGFEAALFWTAVSFALASQCEELVLMALLPAWTPNARGLYWLRRSRESAS